MAPIREEITSRLRDELVAGNFEAGVPLRESVMAQKYGVSRGPVRDAFLQLAQEGFLNYQSNRGVTVRHPPSIEDREFVASLRSQIEIYIVRKGFSGVSPDGVEEIRRALKELHAACQTSDVIEIAKSDMDFHEAMMIECGGEDHIQVWRQLCARMLLTYSRLKVHQDAYSEHVVIYEAFQEGDLEKALQAIRVNVT